MEESTPGAIPMVVSLQQPVDPTSDLLQYRLLPDGYGFIFMSIRPEVIVVSCEVGVVEEHLQPMPSRLGVFRQFICGVSQGNKELQDRALIIVSAQSWIPVGICLINKAKVLAVLRPVLVTTNRTLERHLKQIFEEVFVHEGTGTFYQPLAIGILVCIIPWLFHCHRSFPESMPRRHQRQIRLLGTTVHPK